MAKTVVGVYRDRTKAQAVVNNLVQAGFDREDVSLMTRDPRSEGRRVEHEEGNKAGEGAATGAGIGAVLGGIAGVLVGLGTVVIPGLGGLIVAGPLAAGLAGAGIGAGAGAVIGALIGLGIPEEEATYYAEAVRRGNTLVAVRTSDAMAPRAVDILEDHDPIDIEQAAATWRAEGWTAADLHRETTVERHEEVEVEREPTTRRTGETTLEEVEEELHVGKREVERGGVRARTHVIKEPVEEEVTLRDEEIRVERRKVDRPATEEDLREMERREGEVIEMHERDEEAVVAKEARVTGEVEIEKDVRERTEVVHDEVRRVEVEVEKMTPEMRRERETTFVEYEPRFREHYTETIHDREHPYEYYQSGYRYGYDLGSYEAYRNRRWEDIRPEARRRWEERNRGTWDQFEAAIREGWNRARRER